MTNRWDPPDSVDGRSNLGLDGLRILVVDDDESQSAMYVFTLERLGAAVAPVASAKEAMAALLAHPFDVVVSDVAIPDRAGYELVRGLRTMGHAVPVIALTGWSEPGERETAIAAGFDESCTKPCLPSELAYVIRRLVKPPPIGAH